MLSADGYRERRWGWLPALRTLLEAKPALPDGRLTSADDTRQEALSRLLEIAELAHEHQAGLRDAAREVGADELHRDIDRLERALRHAGQSFEEAALRVHALHHVLEASEGGFTARSEQ
jgi:hypothetical protein